MDKEKTAVEATSEMAATQTPVVLPVNEDLEAKLAALEAEKAKAIEESANYKLAFLKERGRNRGSSSDEAELSEDERIEQIVQQKIADSKVAEIVREQQALLQRALKENKELKLAQLNKTPVAASIGSHVESNPVRDTLVTPEQQAAFKARNWSDKDIERYKRNLLKNTR